MVKFIYIPLSSSINDVYPYVVRRVKKNVTHTNLEIIMRKLLDKAREGVENRQNVYLPCSLKLR